MFALRCRYLFLTLTAGILLASGSGWCAAALPNQDSPGQVVPQKNEVALEGTVAIAPEDWSSPEAAFTLRVVRTIAADGSITRLDPPRTKIVRLNPATRLSWPDPARGAVRADLDWGASVTVVGKDRGVGTPLLARTIQVTTSASEAMGPNLEPPTGDKKSWHGHLQPVVADGFFDTVPDDSSAIVGHVRRSDEKVSWHVQMALLPTLKEGHTYTLRFRARAQEPRLVTLDSTASAINYKNIGLHQTVGMDTVWRPYHVVFKAEGTGDHQVVAPSFQLGCKTGDVWLADIALVDGDHSPPLSELPTPAIGKNLLFYPTHVDCWSLLTIDGAEATLTADTGSALRVTVTKGGASGRSSVQVFQMTDLQPKRKYRLRFRARADAAQTIGATTGLDRGDYHLTGLDRRLMLGTDWRPFDLTFTVNDTDPGHVRAGFSVGAASGTYWFSDLSLELLPQ